MKLYSYYRSSCSYRVRIALEHKQLSYEYLPVHLVKEGGEQHKASFSKLNPKNEVPVLVDQNRSFSQSMSIFLYLDRSYLERPLFPKEMPLFEHCIEICEIINSGIQPLQNLSVLQKLQRDFKISENQKKEWMKHYILKGLKAYQNSLDHKGAFSIGDEPTAADMFLIPQLYNAHRYEVDQTELQDLIEIEKNCLELEIFQKALPENQPDAPK